MDGATVTVSKTTTTTSVSTNLRFDPSYVRTIPGILKVAQILTSLCGFICSQISDYSRYHSSGGWYSFVSMTALWVTLILLILYLFHVIEKLHIIPWLMAEFGFCALWAVLYFIAAVVAAVNAPYDESWGAACFFAFLAMFLYGCDGFLKFKGWRRGDLAQGERTVTSDSSTDNQNYPKY